MWPQGIALPLRMGLSARDPASLRVLDALPWCGHWRFASETRFAGVVRHAPGRECASEAGSWRVLCILGRPRWPTNWIQLHLTQHRSQLAVRATGCRLDDAGFRLAGGTGHRRCRRLQQFPAELQIGLTVAVGVEPIMTDALEASRDGVQQEAADKLVCLKRHGPLLLWIG